MTDDEQQPSPLMKHLFESFEDALPPTEHSELAEFESQLDSTSNAHDARRAWRCAQWAMKLVGEPHESSVWHSIHEVKEAYRLLADMLFGAEFGLETDFGSMGIGTTGPAFDAQIECVDNAVKVARNVADKDGWSAVHWQPLLSELIAMG